MKKILIVSFLCFNAFAVFNDCKVKIESFKGVHKSTNVKKANQLIKSIFLKNNFSIVENLDEANFHFSLNETLYHYANMYKGIFDKWWLGVHGEIEDLNTGEKIELKADDNFYLFSGIFAAPMSSVIKRALEKTRNFCL